MFVKIYLLDVGLLLKESFFCGDKGGQILTCCPLEGTLEKEKEKDIMVGRSAMLDGK